MSNQGEDTAMSHEASIDYKIATWTELFRNYWRNGGWPNSKFRTDAQALFAATPLNAFELFQAWSRQLKVQAFVMPRLLDHLFILVDLKMMREADIVHITKENLAAIFQSAESPQARVSNIAEIVALQRLEKITMHRLQTSGSKAESASAMTSMRLFELIGFFAGTALSQAVVTGVVLALGEAIAKLLVAHVNELSSAGDLSRENGKPPGKLKGAFSKVVPTFIQILSQSGSPMAANLILLQQQSKLQEGMNETLEDVVMPGADTMAFNEVHLVDSPVVPTRSALYVYLTAALIATPRLDEVGLHVFLNARYQDNLPGMVVDLVTAGFDVLAGAQERKESMEVIVIHRSFIANVLPSIIEHFSQNPNFQSGGNAIKKYLAEAVKKVEENYGNTNVLQPGSDACPKQRFLLACALFGFIEESAVPTLLGYKPTQGLSSSGRYNKTKLVQECQADPKRIEQLVGELHLMEGNAAAITRALLEIMHTLCDNRDTMTLKLLCVAFLRKPHNVNIMLLFFDYRSILQPLCNLLDHWQTPDEHGEQLIVYDEFGSILIFVVMCQYRYNLAPSDFATLTPDSFLLKYFQNSALPKQSADISDAERKQLTRWLKGLFEGNGLGDEILSACPPTEFYLLMPTLMDQIMVATQAGVLGIETAVSGVEYLLEPFLLPSLATVLPLFTIRLCSLIEDSSKLDFLMPLLLRLLRPPKVSQESAPLHSAVLTVSAKQLFFALASIKNKHKGRKDVPLLIDALKNYLQTPFLIGMNRPLIEQWSTTRDSDPTAKEAGTAVAFRNSFDNLIKWNAPGKSGPDRQAYNHRLTVWTLKCLDARVVLDILLDQALKASTNPKATDQALDTLTGLIAASMLTVSDQTLTLRGALQEADQKAQLRPIGEKGPPSSRRTFTMRLSRRVDLHCTRPITQVTPTIGLNPADSAMVLDAAGQIAAGTAGLGAAGPSQVEFKDIPMPEAQEMLASLDASAADGNLSVQQGEQAMTTASLMDMGDGMGDIGDLEFRDYLQDMGVSDTQNFDDIFGSM